MAAKSDAMNRAIAAMFRQPPPGAKPTEGGWNNLLKKWGKDVGVRKGAGTLMAMLALQQLLSAHRQAADIGLQREALAGQAELMTPENLYYQAALPTAQAQEQAAKQALLSQISGGVIGPSLARGERMIGG